MPDRSEAILRVEPHQIPALRAAFTDAADAIENELDNLRREGQIPEPWMGDPISTKIKTAYDDHALNGPNSTFAHLQYYRDELRTVATNLGQMEDGYRRTEGDNAALWESKA